ncbi:MAG: YdcF family protein [Planctomycetes bacterium]|nr:YdcF family protein [Planctomycetota bacterium]
MEQPLPTQAPWRRRARRVVAGLLLGATLSGGALLLDGRDREGPADVAVVLGSKVHESGVPSELLRDRLDRAVDLFREGRVRYVLVSGALGQEGHQEADVMADYLIAQGVPDSSVLRDPEGWTTYHTAIHTAEILRARGWRRAIAVSTYYHQSRCRMSFERAGVPVVLTARARVRMTPRDAYSIPREMLGWLYYAVRPY